MQLTRYSGRVLCEVTTVATVVSELRSVRNMLEPRGITVLSVKASFPQQSGRGASVGLDRISL